MVLPRSRPRREKALGFYAIPNSGAATPNFSRYPADNRKREMRRLDAKITDPVGGYNKLMGSHGR